MWFLYKVDYLIGDSESLVMSNCLSSLCSGPIKLKVVATCMAVSLRIRSSRLRLTYCFLNTSPFIDL